MIQTDRYNRKKHLTPKLIVQLTKFVHLYNVVPIVTRYKKHLPPKLIITSDATSLV